jgi:adenine-specific DNA methylase
MAPMIQCPECGFMHPPVEPGKCPVALGRKQDDERKTEEAVTRAKMGQKVFDMFKTVQNDFMHKFQDASDEEIAFVTAKLRNIILNFQTSKKGP